MRTDSHSFGAFRYFIVPCEQMSLFDTVEEKRATAVNSFFSQLAEMKNNMSVEWLINQLATKKEWEEGHNL